MNKLVGTISVLDSSDHLSLVDMEVAGDTFTAIVVETPASAPYLQVGSTVSLLFKETEVSLAKGLSGQLSLRNRMSATVQAIERGRLLSEVTLDYKGRCIVSVITTRSVERLALQPGDHVEALVKANEVALMEGGGDL